ncbi:hypothetical protein PLICRDRAFT_32870 [Plicaturopsis crispa FD-325 SS-3]|uniref:Uncharacterized protein n=1 Tax=Plicaturopsis crispa FD-325 SS-3 TaxID=944288 RepID=A0A0C9T5X7_PLICR|nr:hypothetical protein PLICRDRAFT_32870 [Plicaturopsis crispa FD-325 SS-3]
MDIDNCSTFTRTWLEICEIDNEILALEHRAQPCAADTAASSTVHLLSTLVDQVRSGVDGRGVRSVNGMVVGVGSTYLGGCNAIYASFAQQIRCTKPTVVPWTISVPAASCTSGAYLDLKRVEDTTALPRPSDFVQMISFVSWPDLALSCLRDVQRTSVALVDSAIQETLRDHPGLQGPVKVLVIEWIQSLGQKCAEHISVAINVLTSFQGARINHQAQVSSNIGKKLSALSVRYLAHRYGSDHPNPPHNDIPLETMDTLRAMAESEVTFEMKSEEIENYVPSAIDHLLVQCLPNGLLEFLISRLDLYNPYGSKQAAEWRWIRQDAILVALLHDVEPPVDGDGSIWSWTPPPLCCCATSPPQGAGYGGGASRVPLSSCCSWWTSVSGRRRWYWVCMHIAPRCGRHDTVLIAAVYRCWCATAEFGASVGAIVSPGHRYAVVDAGCSKPTAHWWWDNLEGTGASSPPHTANAERAGGMPLTQESEGNGGGGWHLQQRDECACVHQR